MNTTVKHEQAVSPYSRSRRFYVLCRSGENNVIPCPPEPITLQHPTVQDAVRDWQTNHPEIPGEELRIVSVTFQFENKLLASPEYQAAIAATKPTKGE